MDTGSIGEYCWGQVFGEEPELSIAEVVRALSNYVIGLRAVNVSWDLFLSSREIRKLFKFSESWPASPNTRLQTDRASQLSVLQRGG